MSSQDLKITLPCFIKLRIKILQNKIINNLKNNSIQCDFQRVTEDNFIFIKLSGDLGIFNFSNTETQILPYNEYSFSFQTLQYHRDQLFLTLVFDRSLVDHLLINVKTRRHQIVTNIPIMRVPNMTDQDLQPVLTLYKNINFSFNVVHTDICLYNEIGDRIYILVAGKKGVSFQPPSYYQQLPSQLIDKAQTQTIPKHRGVTYNASQSLVMQNLQGNTIFSQPARSTPVTTSQSMSLTTSSQSMTTVTTCVSQPLMSTTH